ncbi:hypothetical protein HD554DRAFT_2117330, partial [Boletus coccyginus]
MSCDDCFKTVAHTGTPSGRTDTIAGVPTYVAESAAAALLYFADVFGPFCINNQLIQDWFASNGILALQPANHILTCIRRARLLLWRQVRDAHETARLRPGSLARQGHRSSTRVHPKVGRGSQTTLRSEILPPCGVCADAGPGTTGVNYFAVGYCFGAPYVFSLASDPTFHLVAGAVAHPSNIYDSKTKQLKVDAKRRCWCSRACSTTGTPTS